MFHILVTARHESQGPDVPPEAETFVVMRFSTIRFWTTKRRRRPATEADPCQNPRVPAHEPHQRHGRRFEKGVGHLCDLYGAEFNLDLPGAHWHAGLITIGGVMFGCRALPVPVHARFGPHYVGIEYQVPDADEARDEVWPGECG